MPLPSINVTVGQNSFVTSSSETSGNYIAGAVLRGLTLINAVGTTSEISDGFMVVPDLENWNSRLNSKEGNGAGFSFDGFGGGVLGESLFYTGLVNGGTGATGTQVRWPQGPSGGWTGAWWTIHNYLEYGGKAIVGVSTSDPFTSGGTAMNCIFDADGLTDSELSGIQTKRDNDVLVLRKITSKSGTTDGTNKYHIFIYGTKQRLNPATNYVEDTKFITTPLTADLAGCLARTNRVANDFNSPAGFKRGRILSNVRLPNSLNATEANTLNDNNVNVVLSFPDQGVVLFSDKTASGEKIGSVNLLLLITDEIGKISRNSLFEINNETTRESFSIQSQAFLQSLVIRGGISNFKIICDKTNNTDADIQAGKFNAQINYTPINSIGEVTLIFTDTLGQGG